MKIFIYTSPHKYYLDNLMPLVKCSSASKHDIRVSFSSKHTEDVQKSNEKVIIGKDACLEDFFSKKYKPDIVILSQPWWYVDKKIASFCNKNKINFYIVDHAAPMSRFVEKNGKKSHLYRSNILGAKAFFSYGESTGNIMRKVGCRGNIVPAGSPRIEAQLNIAKKIVSEDKIVIYDTSHRMECENSVKESISLAKSLSKQHGLDIFVRQHPRTSGLVASMLTEKKILKSEIEAAATSAFCIFTFPSSSMLLPAILEKKIATTYYAHFDSNIRKYYKRYSKEFSNHIRSKSKYNQFIQDNLYMPKHGSANFIIKWIEKNENSI